MNSLYIPSKSGHGAYHAIIEIPAGTNKKIEINKNTGAFEQNLRNNIPRIIDYLPYPVNYGFIPSTKMIDILGGDGDPLDVLLVCESLPIGFVIEFIPLAVLNLVDNGQLDSKILGIPKSEFLQTIKAENFNDLKLKYNSILDLIEMWFLNYDASNDKLISNGWGDEQLAIKEIDKWCI